MANMPSLVNDIENSALLKYLLDTLEKHNCFNSPVWKGRRSPWVKAFCDLYHPAGPWGEKKFRRSLPMTSPSRYSFKSSKVQKVYETLKNGCLHLQTSETHRRLLNKLEEFMSKQKYYNEYMAACKMIADQEVKKPQAERAPIPSIEVTDDSGVSAAAPETTDQESSDHAAHSTTDDNAHQGEDATSPNSKSPGMSAHDSGRAQEASAASNHFVDGDLEQQKRAKKSPKRSSTDDEIEEVRVEKRQRLEVTAVTKPRTRSQSRNKREIDSAVASTAALVSPEQSRRKNGGIPKLNELEISTTTSTSATTESAVNSERNANVEEQMIQDTRDKLAKVLSKRAKEGNGDDKISKRINSKIDQLDEALIDLILLQE